ncbi:MAG: suppressor of fused domain protein [Gammaproteobacteria bacterium]|nr:suppressor of fused domain protein [Gammaproteobacteria bacterium]
MCFVLDLLKAERIAMGDETPILEHLERYLGAYEQSVDKYWSHLGGRAAGVYGEELKSYHVLGFKNQPIPGSHTYVTLGLGRHLLKQTAGIGPNKDVRMELAMSAYDSVPAEAVVRVLSRFADDVLRLHEAPYDGEVIDWKTPLSENSEFRHLYCTHPFYFPEGLYLCTETDPKTVICMLFAVSAREASYAAVHGLDFNRLIAEQMPDLLAFDSRNELKLEESDSVNGE